MTARQFHRLLLVLAIVSMGLLIFIDHPAEAALPRRWQPVPPKGTVPDAAAAPVPWMNLPQRETGPGPLAAADSGERPLLRSWRTFPVQACVFIENGRVLHNHLALGPYGRVAERLGSEDRGKLWNLFCRLVRESPADLEQLGQEALLEQIEQAESVAWLGTSRAAFEKDAGSDLPADWARLENSPRGTLVWWLALAFPAAKGPALAPLVPAGGFQASGETGWAHPEGSPAVMLYTAHAGDLPLYAVTVDRLMLISPSREVLRRALLRREPSGEWGAGAGEAGSAPVETLGFREFRKHLAQTPEAELHGFAEGELLAQAAEDAHVPAFYTELMQVRKFDRLLVDARLKRNRIELTASVEVPQRSVYDFIALAGPRRLDQYLPADALGFASLRLNLPGLIRYAVTLASQGYFGAKAQQAALVAGPMLTMTNLPAAFGNEVTAALAPSQDKTYLAWSFALPWRQPHTLKEIASVGGLAGAPFEGPTQYRGERVITPKFKAKMEFRYPVLVELPEAYEGPPSPVAAGATAGTAAGEGAEKPSVPAKDNVLLIAANGWNLNDVLNVKQGKVRNLGEAEEFQIGQKENTGDAAVQVFLNLSHGFGYAYVTILGELYGLPVNGVPLEEHLLPRSEAFGPMGFLWVSLGREKLPESAADAAEKRSRLKFHLVWKME